MLKEGTARAWIVPGHRVAHGLPVCSGVLALAHSKHRTDNGTAVLVGVLPNAGGMCGTGLQGGSPRPPSLGLTPTCGQLLRWRMPWTQPPLLAESNSDSLGSETRGLKGLCEMTQQGSQPCPLPVGLGGGDARRALWLWSELRLPANYLRLGWTARGGGDLARG